MLALIQYANHSGQNVFGGSFHFLLLLEDMGTLVRRNGNICSRILSSWEKALQQPCPSAKAMQQLKLFCKLAIQQIPAQTTSNKYGGAQATRISNNNDHDHGSLGLLLQLLPWDSF